MMNTTAKKRAMDQRDYERMKLLNTRGTVT